jgi:hypothetical protein
MASFYQSYERINEESNFMKKLGQSLQAVCSLLGVCYGLLTCKKRDDFGKERSENLSKKVKLLNFQAPESKPLQHNQAMEGYLFFVCSLAHLYSFFLISVVRQIEVEMEKKILQTATRLWEINAIPETKCMYRIHPSRPLISRNTPRWSARWWCQ